MKNVFVSRLEFIFTVNSGSLKSTESTIAFNRPFEINWANILSDSMNLQSEWIKSHCPQSINTVFMI